MFFYQPIQDGEYQPIRYPSNMVRPCVHAICHEGGWFLESFQFECTSFSWCFPSSWAPLHNTKRHLLCTFIYKPKTESNSVDSCEWSKQQTGHKQQIWTQLVSSWRASVDTVALFLFSRITFCITAYPFNCKALMGSGHFWHGRWFLLTFLTQFPWKVPVYVPGNRRGDMRTDPKIPRCLVTLRLIYGRHDRRGTAEI